jgi:hypothetical protein
MGRINRGIRSMGVVKRHVFRSLEWLFEGETLTPAVCVMLYVIVWFLPVWKPNVESGTDLAVWNYLGWQPNLWWAIPLIALSVYQVVCCRILRCIWWTRVATSVLVTSFVIYTVIAPAYAMWVKTGSFSEYFAGSTVVVFACVLLVARNLQRESEDGERAA